MDFETQRVSQERFVAVKHRRTKTWPHHPCRMRPTIQFTTPTMPLHESDNQWDRVDWSDCCYTIDRDGQMQTTDPVFDLDLDLELYEWPDLQDSVYLQSQYRALNPREKITFGRPSFLRRADRIENLLNPIRRQSRA